jgi:hypothetical protein
VSNKIVSFCSLSLLLVLAACGEIQTEDQSNQPTGDIRELNLPSPEAQLQETLAGTLKAITPLPTFSTKTNLLRAFAFVPAIQLIRCS